MAVRVWPQRLLWNSEEYILGSLTTARKKLTIVKVTSATKEGVAKKSPVKGGTKRRAPWKFKPKPCIPLDLNAIPEEEEEVLVKPIRKRAPQKKTTASQNDSECSKQSIASITSDSTTASVVFSVPFEKSMCSTMARQKDIRTS